MSFPYLPKHRMTSPQPRPAAVHSGIRSSVGQRLVQQEDIQLLTACLELQRVETSYPWKLKTEVLERVVAVFITYEQRFHHSVICCKAHNKMLWKNHFHMQLEGAATVPAMLERAVRSWCAKDDKVYTQMKCVHMLKCSTKKDQTAHAHTHTHTRTQCNSRWATTVPRSVFEISLG